MPEGVRNMILNGQGCVQGVSTVVFKDGRGLFLNMGRLGREQMERIREVEGEGGKLLVWTHGDRWCPVEGRRKIQQRFSNIRVEVVDVSHAFVMSEADTIDIVRVVAPWLCDLVLKG